MTTARLVVGCMSGTSMDGIDAALMSIAGEGLGMAATLVRTASCALPHSAELRAFADGGTLSARDLRSISLELGEAHRDLVAGVLRDETPDLVVMHGQTVLHDPPLSWQIADPWPVAAAFGCRVVTDLRSRSIACGGQGAPLTPLADWVLFRDAAEPCAVVNLGGFVNFTQLPSGSDPARMTGGDVCACNLVLDRLARDRLGVPFDADGRAAVSGDVDGALSAQIARRLGEGSGRSLGTRDEAGWVDAVTASLPAADALATVCDAIARAITARLEPVRAVLAGGGVANRALVDAIRAHHAGPVQTSDQLGMPAQYREAAGFAVLGALAEDGVPISLPQVTGSAETGRAGQWVLP